MIENSALAVDGAAASPYPSLESLRAAHNDLIQQRRAHGDGDAGFLDTVSMFVRRAQLTGALLDSDDDRWAAQSMLNFWANVMFRAGHQTSDVALDEYDPARAPELPDEACPYLGLDAFAESNTAVFFGRQTFLNQLIARLAEVRLLAVLGSSGSGKSSLVMGGLIPALKRGAAPGSDTWRYLPPLVPGNDPLANLARLTRPDTTLAIEWTIEQVKRYLANPNHLLSLIGATPTVLYVDQFEEIFTLCDDEATRQAFIDNLVALVEAPEPRHMVILTMRSDFEERVVLLPQLQALFAQGQMRVPPLSAGELREAIERPASLVGLKFDAGVVDELIKEILGEPAGLPLLQFTLLKLWENRQRNRVTWETYRRVGGGRRALARSADEFYNGLIPEEQVTARRILLRVVRPGEGLEYTSNRIRRDNLYQAGEARERVDRVLNKLIAARLMRVTPGDTAADDQIGVAHEALVRNWPRLVDWLEEERAAINQRRRLEAKAAEWVRLGRGSAGLLDDVQLLEAERWLSSAEASYLGYDETLPELVRESRVALEKARREQEQARQRELEQARQLATEQQGRAEAERRARAEAEQRAESERRTGSRLRVYAILLAVASLAAAIAAYYAIDAARREGDLRGVAEQSARENQQLAQQRQEALATAEIAKQEADTNAVSARRSRDLATEAQQTAEVARGLAEQQAQLARSGELAAQSRAAAARGKPQLSLLLAVEAVNTRIAGQEAPAIATDALSSSLQLSWGQGLNGTISNLAVSADGRRLAAGTAAGAVRLWDLAAADPPASLQTLQGTAGAITWISLSPNDRWLLTGHQGATVRVWDLTAADPAASARQLERPDGPVVAAALSADGRWLALASGAVVQVWDLPGGQAAPAVTLSSHRGAVQALAISPNSRWLLSGGADGRAILWDLNQRGTISARPFNARGAITAVAFSGDGRRLATGSADEDVHLWPFDQNSSGGATASAPFVLSIHQGAISALAFSPDGRWLVSASEDTTARVWEVASITGQQARPRSTLLGHIESISGVAISPDSRWLATYSADRSARLWDLNAASPAESVAVLRGHDGAVIAAGFSASSTLLASGGGDGTARLWPVPAPTSAERNATIAAANPAERVALACQASGRNLSQDEWQQYRPGLPYQSTCTQFPQQP